MSGFLVLSQRDLQAVMRFGDYVEEGLGGNGATDRQASRFVEPTYPLVTCVGARS
jgi:hypothetical protein